MTEVVVQPGDAASGEATRRAQRTAWSGLIRQVLPFCAASPRVTRNIESFAAFVLLATIRIWIRFVQTAQPLAHIFTARNPTNIALGDLR
jgi:hypothetical protein